MLRYLNIFKLGMFAVTVTLTLLYFTVWQRQIPFKDVSLNVGVVLGMILTVVMWVTFKKGGVLSTSVKLRLIGNTIFFGICGPALVWWKADSVFLDILFYVGGACWVVSMFVGFDRPDRSEQASPPE